MGGEQDCVDVLRQSPSGPSLMEGGAPIDSDDPALIDSDPAPLHPDMSLIDSDPAPFKDDYTWTRR